ncbi:ABC transporter ATP-binding protein [Bryobacter aggregatus]|uniref:ABC transporter ATP-binding protein n=1 Tax=Bryobacter aggregatus TaxID=360054 RepID=UPI00068C2EC4|nr:ABC transporter ATP-binding protein [Bryobacter aggregatus]
MSLLAIEALRFAYPGFELGAVTARLEGPQIVSLIGPNGAGKSTLLDLLAGLKTASSGDCLLAGKSIRTLTREQACRIVAHVPQQVPMDAPFLVEDVILTGRLPHSSGLFESPADEAALEAAIDRVKLSALRHRVFSSLSGGERQRVLIAAAVCQQAPILLLDEPSAHLDPENEVLLWELLEDLKRDGCLILIATHHLSLAAQHSDRIWLMCRGELVANAESKNGLPLKQMQEVFRVAFHWQRTPEGQVFLNYGR